MITCVVYAFISRVISSSLSLETYNSAYWLEVIVATSGSTVNTTIARS